ncbi:SGNH/GDSL hydrolase family protein [Halalkalibaculum sp. DA3122]|uniref:SGNH/GDSL hydrolase family protein n=1 Tax=Halalkalibaculum sp. DA3122 TaxID=3373607 RepID=UPI0037547A12
MRSAKISSLSILLLLVFLQGCATAEITTSEEEKSTPFELRHGDRVVLLGNSLIQNDLEYGYIEYALTTRWPGRDITFRNLGWTGDTVHGEARSYYTTPPDSYELLTQQLEEAEPTVVFVAYGANEAYAGKEGVSRFKEGLQKLLDKIDELDARAVLLSPIPQLAGSPSGEGITQRNENLALYSSVIAQTAAERDLRYINLFDPFRDINNKELLTTDGVHLNENGYYFLVSVMEDQLGLSSRKSAVSIDLSGNVIESTGPTTILQNHFQDDRMQFTLAHSILPLPPPPSETLTQEHAIRFQVRGLNNGCYTLTADSDIAASASAERWSDGVQVDRGVLFRQANELRERIVDKNQLFFRKYRPTNRTYLVGFRSHEQGQNAKELEQLDLFISRLEGQIFQLRKPHPKHCTVQSVK